MSDWSLYLCVSWTSSLQLAEDVLNYHMRTPQVRTSHQEYILIFPHKSHCKTKRTRKQARDKTPLTLEQLIRTDLSRIKSVLT